MSISMILQKKFITSITPKPKMTEQKFETIDGLTMEQLIAKELIPHKVEFWGREFMVAPKLCEKVMGDGLQLIYFGTINNRPNYWLLRIDSQTDTEELYGNDETFLLIVEEEFGEYDEDIIGDESSYPIPSPDNGWYWGVVANYGTGVKS
jgi:hypothetical protein